MISIDRRHAPRSPAILAVLLATGATLETGAPPPADAGEGACCDSLVSADASPIHSDPPVLVARKSEWKYLVTPVGLDASWVEPTYDDRAWATGHGIFGYGEPFVDTEIPFGPEDANRYPTTYFRRTFRVNDLSSHLTFSLAANFDDGFVCYLNGQEIAREWMPAGPISYGTFAIAHEGGNYKDIPLNSALPFLRLGTNLLAVELHNAMPDSRDLVFDMEISTTTIAGELARGPYLQVGTPSSMTIRWRTVDEGTSRVTYGTNPNMLPYSVDDLLLTTEHEIVLTGLNPDTRYYYTVGSTAGVIAGGDADHSFRTSPVAGSDGPTRVWVIGDSGEANQEARDVRDAYLAYTGSADTDVWLMLGDNAYGDGKDSEYQAAVFDMYPTILRNTVLWPTRGNHDKLHSGANNDYYEIFTMPTAGEAGGLASGTEAYYSFDHANVHFICLDSEGSSVTWTGPMLNWLAQDLIATNQDWVIAYWHHPPYSKGSHDSDDEGQLVDMREHVLPVLEAVGVDLVLCGHSHSYERSFLLDGHYDVSDSLKPSMILDAGDGRPGGDGAYPKATLGTGSHEGAVYAVAGSSSKTSSGSFDHPAMFLSLRELGSLVLDIEEDRLDAVFINETGAKLDSFTIQKGISTGIDVPTGAERTRLQLLPNDPNPFGGHTRLRYVLPAAGTARVAVYDLQGRLVRTLVDEKRAPGEHAIAWNGRNEHGRPVAPGAYFGVLSFGDEVRTRKLVRVR